MGIRRAVFLDRDGVLNRLVNDLPPRRVEDVAIDDEVPIALSFLVGAGFTLIGVTNQPDVSRGTVTEQSVRAINGYLCAKLPLTCILTCFHDDVDGCECRKPKPGLIMQIAKDLEIDVSRSFLVGDRWRDIGAAKNAGCRSVLLAGFPENLEHSRVYQPDYITNSMLTAAQWIIEQPKGEE